MASAAIVLLREKERERGAKLGTPPTGTVTFLFTDIEGSTKMWERDRAAMSEALARHDEILREAIEANSGYVFKTVGDAFCCAFPTAPDGLEAALGVQHNLLFEQREEGEPLRVRMALHTGAAEERDGDYFGPPVNRVATGSSPPACATSTRCCAGHWSRRFGGTSSPATRPPSRILPRFGKKR